VAKEYCLWSISTFTYKLLQAIRLTLQTADANNRLSSFNWSCIQMQTNIIIIVNTCLQMTPLPCTSFAKMHTIAVNINFYVLNYMQAMLIKLTWHLISLRENNEQLNVAQPTDSLVGGTMLRRWTYNQEVTVSTQGQAAIKWLLPGCTGTNQPPKSTQP